MKTRISFKGLEIADLQDFQGPLSKVIKILNEVQKQYGKKATIFFDAGYNNVAVYVKPSKNQDVRK